MRMEVQGTRRRKGGGEKTSRICSSYDCVLIQRVRPRLVQKYALLSMYRDDARGERPVKTRRQRGTIKLKSRSRMEQNVIHLWIGIQLPAGASSWGQHCWVDHHFRRASPFSPNCNLLQNGWSQLVIAPNCPRGSRALQVILRHEWGTEVSTENISEALDSD